MKRLIITLCLAISLACGSFGVGWSQNFQKGFDAYEKGDYATALKEWTPLAEEGDKEAQYLLGFMYDYGKGIPEDSKTAVKWYTLSAEQGLKEAQNNLGEMYRDGKGVPQDYKSAVKWYTLSAEQGYADAQLNLGVMYALGQGVIDDKVYAHMWSNIASSNGIEQAKENREYLTKKMTPSQILEAQKLARECVKKSYKGC